MNPPVEKPEQRLDRWLTEIEANTEAIRAKPNLTLSDLSAYYTRWDGIRTEAFRFRSTLWPVWFDAKSLYEDELRKHMAKGTTRRQNDFTAWEERKASYEAKEIVHLQALRSLDRTLTQVDAFLRYLRDKEKWLETLRFNIMHTNNIEKYASGDENVVHT